MKNVTAKPLILAAAIALAKQKGLYQFSRKDVAERIGMDESLPSWHFKTMANLRLEVIKHAVEHEILPILADARASREAAGVPMSAALKKKVAAYIAR